MLQRNWTELSRKLVDTNDMSYSFSAVQAYLGEQALSFFGEGVLTTTTYPTPFPITMSGTYLGGSVGTGIAFDPNGAITRIDPGTTTSTNFTIATADPSLERYDLLVIRYAQTGDTLIPQPSNPINNIYLNLHDDFTLAVITGTPSNAPTYPAKGSLDVVLAGLRVPAGATLGTSVTVDLGVRDIALPYDFAFPQFKAETPSGTVDGTNTVFTLSETPVNAASVLVIVDDLQLESSAWTISGSTITLSSAPAVGQSVFCWYVYNGGGGDATLPIYANQETLGIASGSTATFNFTGVPLSQYSLLLFINGRYIQPNYYTLNLGSTNSVTFNETPAQGSTISAFYFQQVPNGLSAAVSAGENLGSGVGIFEQVYSQTMQFKSLIAGVGMSITDNGNGTVTLASSGGGGSGLPEVHGSFLSPITISASSGITPTTAAEQVWWVTPGTGEGATPVTSSPQIAAGVSIGQRLKLKGVSATDYLSFVDGNGLSINGPCYLNNNQSIDFTWDGVQWSEDTRRN